MSVVALLMLPIQVAAQSEMLKASPFEAEFSRSLSFENNFSFKGDKPCIQDFSAQFVPLMRGGLMEDIPRGIEAVRHTYNLEETPKGCVNETDGGPNEPTEGSGKDEPKSPPPDPEVVIAQLLEYFRLLEAKRWLEKMSECQDSICLEDDALEGLDPRRFIDFFFFDCRNAICIDYVNGTASISATTLLYALQEGAVRPVTLLCGADEFCTSDEIERLKLKRFVISLPQLRTVLEAATPKKEPFEDCRADGCPVATEKATNSDPNWTCPGIVPLL